MKAPKKLGLGAALASLGGVGMALAPTLGATALGRPWSFLAGFAVGMAGGIGVALAVFGLIELRRAK